MILYCGFRQLPQCIYPIVSSFFYTTLCEEQDVGQVQIKYKLKAQLVKVVCIPTCI